jgi:hypothetical protein
MAEFKRASNDFKYQLQSELEKAGADANPASPPGAQQTTSFTQTLLPPAVNSAISEIDGAHQRLMKTARMAFDAQNFTLRPPEEPVVASAGPEPPSAVAAQDGPAAPVGPVAASHESSPVHESYPVEAMTDHPKPDSAPAASDSGAQSS